ncbi:hypothetical protein HFN65_23830 [Rhizobium laguerreae]|uniref:DUF6894 family protein n=1 Tax=Rhizobium laguerreae TaxID=1076926 RepID=UPI001441C0D7|nr:hypothetical protein [Rhizobium laguerreae]MBY3318450.1 hypothetical protein [Rhizobium laguerreae]MBY3358712.1 hypothetical protein [Rhizobium laguerreae]MBY3501353.1 hypothetical protein [Rhizobium laguerreae]MBY3574006.1 hypothetical protein [Rhizobium laguerreae]NKN04572.1 hypothetical protein [Rhizobium laguerreae]
MARYFFNVHDGISILDTVGSEHPDLQSARTEAVETIAERLRGALLKEANVSAWLMNVTDERGLTVMVLSFTAAVQIVDHVNVAGQVLGALTGVALDCFTARSHRKAQQK